jgi:hypothetical protein
MKVRGQFPLPPGGLAVSAFSSASPWAGLKSPDREIRGFFYPRSANSLRSCAPLLSHPLRLFHEFATLMRSTGSAAPLRSLRSLAPLAGAAAPSLLRSSPRTLPLAAATPLPARPVLPMRAAPPPSRRLLGVQGTASLAGSLLRYGLRPPLLRPPHKCGGQCPGPRGYRLPPQPPPQPQLLPPSSLRQEQQRNAALLRGRSFLAQPRRGCPLRFLATPGAYACGPPSGAPRAAPCGPGRPRRFAGPVRRLRPRFARRARPPSLPPGSFARPPLRPRFAAGSGGSRCPPQPRRPIRSAAGSRRLRSGCPCSAPGRLWASRGPPGPPRSGPFGASGRLLPRRGGGPPQAAALLASPPRLFAAFGRCSQRSAAALGPALWPVLR